MPTTKGRATKERIVKTAARLIHTRGYKNTSLEDILAESGVTKGSFYFHFATKDDLVHAAIDRFFGGIERRLTPLFEGEGTPMEKVSAYLDGMAQLMERSGCTGGCLLGNLTLEVSDWHEELRDHLASCFGGLKGLLADVIAQGQRAGEIRKDRTADELAAFVVALLEGALMLSRAAKSTEPMRTLTRDAPAFLKGAN
jgi:TetR/AcrR family transcriptional repressor of nem operon